MRLIEAVRGKPGDQAFKVPEQKPNPIQHLICVRVANGTDQRPPGATNQQRQRQEWTLAKKGLGKAWISLLALCRVGFRPTKRQQPLIPI